MELLIIYLIISLKGVSDILVYFLRLYKSIDYIVAICKYVFPGKISRILKCINLTF